eukprot:TRINITY_DN4873_c0_g1_i2.p1 TRINITY_DN4873_c0_g1~~TRINITY_DN4873_c0_g1_i2.p1  ORF type:complete len:539 (+),score=130.33 TRINITY_DN4873_c0_g1_i2:116-1618(+)
MTENVPEAPSSPHQTQYENNQMMLSNSPPPNQITANIPPPLNPMSQQMPSQQVLRFSDIECFVRVKLALGPEKWRDFIKCLDLYNNQILSTKQELLILVRDLFINTNIEVWHKLRSYLGVTKEEVPDEFEAVNVDSFDKNMQVDQQQNWQNEQLSGQSIQDIPVDQQSLYHQSDLSIISSFKHEDCRSYWDSMIERIYVAICILENIQRRLQSSNDVKDLKILPEEVDVCVLSVVRKVYGDTIAPRILQSLFSHPEVTVNIILSRLKQKDNDWNLAKHSWYIRWRNPDISKSLDDEKFNYIEDQKKQILPQSLYDQYQHLNQNKFSKSILFSYPDYELFIRDRDVYQDVRMIIDFVRETRTEKYNFDILLNVFDLFFSKASPEKLEEAYSNISNDISPIPLNNHVIFGDKNVFTIFRYIQMIFGKFEQARKLSLKHSNSLSFNNGDPMKMETEPSPSDQVIQLYQSWVDSVMKVLQDQIDQPSYELLCSQSLGVCHHSLL